ncbi:RNA polymerase subunit sigma-24 [Rubripirellula amarantea]|nr:RNA polymerase subunit sigma-24 [Rubripirellula amarantea]
MTARMALEELCKAYWYPLYAFVRSRGHSADDAQDLTQAFFAKIIESNGLASADESRGRFRSYLLGAMKHFLSHQRERAVSLKRGGGTQIIQFDSLDPEARFAVEPSVNEDLDAEFNRQWAQEITSRALDILRLEMTEAGKANLFAVLKVTLTGEEFDRSLAAEQLAISDGAAKVAIHRMRARYREVLRMMIAQTVADESEVDDEMRDLVKAL